MAAFAHIHQRVFLIGEVGQVHVSCPPPRLRHSSKERTLPNHVDQVLKDTAKPSTNADYWLPKLDRNVARDKVSNDALRAHGWRLRIVWECEITSL